MTAPPWLLLHPLAAGRCLVLAQVPCGAAALEVQLVLGGGGVESVWARRLAAPPPAQTNGSRGRVAPWHGMRRHRRSSAPAPG